MLRAVWTAVFLAAAAPVSAEFFTPDELAQTRQRTVPRIEDILRDDIIGNLPRALRPAAAQIRLSFPDTSLSPLAFWADPATATITLPIESIRFFDDLATIYAWFESKGCEPGLIQTYLWALLRDGQPLPSPLRAFSIDRDTAFADLYTYDVSGKIVSSGVLFVLAHEVGHLMLGHQGGLHGARSQAQEIAADDFAMDHFARIGAMPLGVVYYFLAAWWQDPVEVTQVRAHSHPVSPGRIAAVAARMQADPMSFAFSQPDPKRAAQIVRQTAGYVETLAEIAADNDMLTLMPLGLERDFPVSRFATACPD